MMVKQAQLACYQCAIIEAPVIILRPVPENPTPHSKGQFVNKVGRPPKDSSGLTVKQLQQIKKEEAEKTPPVNTQARALLETWRKTLNKTDKPKIKSTLIAARPRRGRPPGVKNNSKITKNSDKAPSKGAKELGVKLKLKETGSPKGCNKNNSHSTVVETATSGDTRR